MQDSIDFNENIKKKKDFLPVAFIWCKENIWLLSIVLTYLIGGIRMLFLPCHIDFSSFYAALDLLYSGNSPYQVTHTPCLNVDEHLPANLNPPFVLTTFKFLNFLPFRLALFFWILFSLSFAFASFRILLQIITTPAARKGKEFLFLGAYLLCFSTLVDIFTGQLGQLMLFLLIFGYYFEQRDKDYWAGFFWGILIATKFFPGLLFFYALKRKKYTLFFSIGIVALLCSLLPLAFGGILLYKQYFSMLAGVRWYGDTWNASIVGYLWRLFPALAVWHPSVYFTFSYLLLLVSTIIWYLRYPLPLEKEKNHQPFCLILVLMLIFSPLGWLYYFSLLALPCLLVWVHVFTRPGPYTLEHFLVSLSIFFLEFPFFNHHLKYIPSFSHRVIFAALPFYGLLLLVYLLQKNPFLPGFSKPFVLSEDGLKPLKISLIYGLCFLHFHFFFPILREIFSVS